MNEKRLAQLHDLLQAEPNDPFLIYAVAQEYLAAGDPAGSLPWFARLAEEHPDYVATYYHYGMALYQNGDDRAAVEVWQKGAALAEQAGDRKTAAEIRELLEDVDAEW